jgi:hypothetical protein
MFGRHEIRVPAGFAAVVNSEIVSNRPLYVRRYDQIYFINFAPHFISVSFATRSREGIEFHAKASVRVGIQREDLGEVLRSAGDSNYRDTLRVSAKNVADGLNLAQSIAAAIETFVRASGFFDLADQEGARAALDGKIKAECANVRLAGALISIELSPRLPTAGPVRDERGESQEPLVQLRAELGARAQTDASLAGMVEYLAEMAQQHEQIKRDTERARADLKIAALDADDRVAAREAELREQETERKRAEHKRNAEIMEINAGYEFGHKKKRLEEEKKLTETAIEVTKIKKADTVAAREQRQLDMLLDLDREKQLTDIKILERQKTLSEIGAIIEKIRGLPVPNYQNVHTLVTNGADSREQMTGMLWNLLANYSNGLAGPETTGSEERLLTSRQRSTIDTDRSAERRRSASPSAS